VKQCSPPKSHCGCAQIAVRRSAEVTANGMARALRSSLPRCLLLSLLGVLR
jgi:hypothetical protein